MRIGNTAVDCSKLDETQIKLMDERCILVDRDDNIIGSETKKNCHLKTNIEQKRMLHRAFSVFLFNNEGTKMLLQQRAGSKITYPNLWSNACCSHPLFEIEHEKNGWEGVKLAAIRRLNYELGVATAFLSVEDFAARGRVHYQAGNSVKTFPDEFMEHEIDYLLFAKKTIDLDNVNKNEVQDTKWVGKEELSDWVKKERKVFTPWFKLIMHEKVFNIWDKIQESNFLKELNEDLKEIDRYAPE